MLEQKKHIIVWGNGDCDIIDGNINDAVDYIFSERRYSNYGHNGAKVYPILDCVFSISNDGDAQKLNTNDKKIMSDNEVIAFVKNCRNLTIRQDLRRHRWALIMHYIGIKRLDVDEVFNCVEWIYELEAILKKGRLGC